MLGFRDGIELVLYVLSCMFSLADKSLLEPNDLQRCKRSMNSVCRIKAYFRNNYSPLLKKDENGFQYRCGTCTDVAVALKDKCCSFEVFIKESVILNCNNI